MRASKGRVSRFAAAVSSGVLERRGLVHLSPNAEAVAGAASTARRQSQRASLACAGHALPEFRDILLPNRGDWASPNPESCFMARRAGNAPSSCHL